MINKISDLQLGKEYSILLIKDKRFVRKAVVKAIINEKEDFNSNQTEIYVSLSQRGKLKSTNLFYAKEIGLGEDVEEAYSNYGRFDFEENDNFENSFKKVKAKNYPTISLNLFSSIMLTPSSSALANLLGPMFSPATM